MFFTHWFSLEQLGMILCAKTITMPERNQKCKKASVLIELFRCASTFCSGKLQLFPKKSDPKCLFFSWGRQGPGEAQARPRQGPGRARRMRERECAKKSKMREKSCFFRTSVLFASIFGGLQQWILNRQSVFEENTLLCHILFSRCSVQLPPPPPAVKKYRYSSSEWLLWQTSNFSS